MPRLHLFAGQITQNECYDEMTKMIIRRSLAPDAVCADVGCHVGAILRMMIGSAPKGRFLAFEPLPQCYAQLLREFSVSRSVFLYNFALSDTEGRSSFKWVESNPAYSGLRERRYDRPNEIVRDIVVEVRTLDSIVAELGLDRLDFIRIDVEGCESLVLEGARQTIARFRPVIVFEHGIGAADFYGETSGRVFDLLRECGLSLSTLDGFLLRKKPLDRSRFLSRFRSGVYYWVAHPN
jgi:FkbM family methyltransferase